MKKTIGLLALSLQLLCGIESKAQDFSVYEALPILPRRTPPPVQSWELPWRPERVYEHPTQQLDNKVVAKFIIKTATIDGQDRSKFYIDNAACLVIYSNKDSKELFFANYMPVSRSISKGIMISPELSNQSETASSYRQQTTKFKWSYSNSYDNKKGIANVQLVMIFQEGQTSFSCTISSKDTFIKYTGQMENSN